MFLILHHGTLLVIFANFLCTKHNILTCDVGRGKVKGIRKINRIDLSGTMDIDTNNQPDDVLCQLERWMNQEKQLISLYHLKKLCCDTLVY